MQAEIAFWSAIVLGLVVAPVYFYRARKRFKRLDSELQTMIEVTSEMRREADAARLGVDAGEG
jgi:hypothetical protein